MPGKKKALVGTQSKPLIVKAAKTAKRTRHVAAATFPKRSTRRHKWSAVLGFDLGTAQNSIESLGSVSLVASDLRYPYPQITGTAPDIQPGDSSHQPYGWNEMINLYYHFIVLGSKCKVTVLNSTDWSSPSPFTIALSTSSTNLFGSATDKHITYDESKKWKTMDITDKMIGNKSISTSYNPKTQLDIKNPRDCAFLRGTELFTPSEGTYFMIAGWNREAVTSSTTILLKVEIDYTVVWSEPKLVGNSN